MTFAVALGALVSLVVVSMMTYAARTFAATGNYADMERASRHAVDMLTTDIRQARTVTSFAPNQVSFTDLTNGTFSYTWDPDACTLTRVYNGDSQVMLTNCDALLFHVWQHTPSNNFNFWPATTTNNAKLVDVSWTCSRTIFGRKVDTESVQSAKVAIRN